VKLGYREKNLDIAFKSCWAFCRLCWGLSLPYTTTISTNQDTGQNRMVRVSRKDLLFCRKAGTLF
jgi:hypothetical protein